MNTYRLMDEQRPSYEDLAQREPQREALQKRGVEHSSNHDWAHLGVILIIGVMGLVLYLVLLAHQ